MKKLILFIAIPLVSIGMKAHQADASTTMLIEKENGTWVLQISSSLTAFQHEIKTHFSEAPYKTPEEFQQMVLEHIKNKLRIEVNDGQVITLSNGVVQLGHDTKVVFEVIGIPKDLKSIVIKNKAFEDIHKSQSSLLLLKEGFYKEQLVLNNSNNHTVALKVDGTSFVEIDHANRSLSSIELVLIVLGVLGAVVLAYKSFQKKNEKQVLPFTLKKVV